MLNNLFNGLKNMGLAMGIFCFAYAQGSQPVELTLKYTGTTNSRGVQGDVTICVKKGTFPYDGADVIVNEAKPNLIGFMEKDCSPIEAAVFQAAGGGLAPAKGTLKCIDGYKVTDAQKKEAIRLFNANVIVFEHPILKVTNNSISPDIARLIREGAFHYEGGSVTTIAPQNNKLKKHIDDLKREGTLPAVCAEGTAHLTEACNLDGCRAIIHAVVPQRNQTQKDELLRAVIKDTLKTALIFNDYCVREGEQPVRNIGFPSLATFYGFPLNQAAPIIVRSIAGFVQSHGQFPISEICFIVASDAEFYAYQNALADYAASNNYQQANDNPIVFAGNSSFSHAAAAPVQNGKHRVSGVHKQPKVSKSQLPTHTASPMPAPSYGVAPAQNVQYLPSLDVATPQHIAPNQTPTPAAAQQPAQHQATADQSAATPQPASAQQAPQYSGFWDTLGQHSWNTSIFDTPGIVWAACKNGWNGNKKAVDATQNDQSKNAQQPASGQAKKEDSQGWSFGSWFNRNFNTICLSTLGLLALRHCF